MGATDYRHRLREAILVSIDDNSTCLSKYLASSHLKSRREMPAGLPSRPAAFVAYAHAALRRSVIKIVAIEAV